MSALIALLALQLACSDDSEESTPGGEGGQMINPVPATEAGLLVWGCEAGERRTAEGDCVAAGVSACPAGFNTAADGGCEAAVPACDPGQMALPGDGVCREVTPCGPGIWGDIVTQSNTQFVDGGYVGPSDGTINLPWKTIQEGLDAADSGAVVAVAASTYAESLVIAKPVTLWGKCPANVHLSGAPALRVDATAPGTVIRGLAITGAQGIVVNGVSGVTIEEVRVHDTTNVGVTVAYPQMQSADVTLRGSLVENATGRSVMVSAGTLLVEDSEVRGTRSLSDTSDGVGIAARLDDSNRTPASLTVRRSRVESHKLNAIQAIGSNLLVEDSLIRDIRPQTSDLFGGSGITAQAVDAPTSAVVRGSIVEECRSWGIGSIGADLEVTDTSVRDTDPSLDPTLVGSDLGFGIGVAALQGADRVAVRVSSSLLAGNSSANLYLNGSSALVEGVIANDGRADKFGAGAGVLVVPGLSMTASSQAVLRGVVAEGNLRTGIEISGSNGTLESVLVRNTQMGDSWLATRGLAASWAMVEGGGGLPAAVVLRDSLVEGNASMGVTARSSTLEMTSTRVTGTRGSNESGSLGFGVLVAPSELTDLAASAQIAHCLIDDNDVVGVLASGATTIVDSVVEGTRAHVSDASYGDGVVAASVYPNQLEPPNLHIDSSRVQGNARAGISIMGANGSISSVHIDCNLLDVVAETFFDIPAGVVDDGGNRCGCVDDARVCKAVSVGLLPPLLP